MNDKVDEQSALRAEGEAQLEYVQRFNKNQALDKLKSLDPYVFEHLVTALFERRGFRAKTAGGTGDEGVDIYLEKGDQRAVVQCKRYDNSVGQPTVRDLYGTMLHNNADEAYLVTTALMTRQAQEWAGNKPIRLIDGFTLVNWIMDARSPSSRRSRFLPNLRRAQAASKSTYRAEGRRPLRYGFWTFLLVAVIVFGFAAGYAFTQVRGRLASDSDAGAGSTLGLQMPAAIQDLIRGNGESNSNEVDQEANADGAGEELTARVHLPQIGDVQRSSSSQPGSPQTEQGLADLRHRPPNNGQFFAYPVPSKTLDARFDDWPDDWVAIRNVAFGGDDRSGVDDLGGQFQLAWSPDGLYLALRAYDDQHRSGPDGTLMWQGDGLEIHFDRLLDADYAETSVGQDDYQIGVSFGPELDEVRGYRWYPYDRERAYQIPGQVQETERGYALEIMIPWEALEVTTAQLAAPASFGFNVSINDNDSDTPAQQTILSASAARTTYDNPTEWGTLVVLAE